MEGILVLLALAGAIYAGYYFRTKKEASMMKSVLIGFLAHHTQGTLIGSQNFCIIFLRPLFETITIFTPALRHSSIQSASSSAGSFSECNLKVLSRSHKSNFTPSFLSNSGVTSSNFSNFLSALKTLIYYILAQ